MDHTRGARTDRDRGTRAGDSEYHSVWPGPFVAAAVLFQVVPLPTAPPTQLLRSASTSRRSAVVRPAGSDCFDHSLPRWLSVVAPHPPSVRRGAWRRRRWWGRCSDIAISGALAPLFDCSQCRLPRLVAPDDLTSADASRPAPRPPRLAVTSTRRRGRRLTLRRGPGCRTYQPRDVCAPLLKRPQSRLSGPPVRASSSAVTTVRAAAVVTSSQCAS